jgi:MoaA/NifB/PqqE/SkfB family radical SAM enzyme
MELNVYNLTIEATRKCNMKCEHCLRGPAQRKTANPQHIYKLLQLIGQVSTLNISGGEPTLAMEILDHIRHCVIYGNCDVGSFYMVTNGKSINVENLAEWIAGMKFACSDNEASMVGVSFDQWHKDTFTNQQLQKQRRNFYRLQEKLTYDYGISESECGGDFVIKHSDNNWDYRSILQEGKAKDWGCKSTKLEEFTFEDYDGTMEAIGISEGNLYLTCSGWIIAGCDWSYQTMDYDKRVQIIHIDDVNCKQDLIDAIVKYQEKIEEGVAAA